MTVTYVSKAQKPRPDSDPVEVLLQGRADPDDAMAIFSVIEKGLEMKVVYEFAKSVTTTTTAAFDVVHFFTDIIGMPARTMQRKVKLPKEILNPDQSARAWRFAQVLSKASEVLGSREAAERWLSKPALGLNGRRPIELLSNSVGYELVNDFLIRMEYGVYQ